MITYKVVPKKNPQTGEFLYYGSIALNNFVDLETIAREIAAQNTLTPTDVTAVLVSLQEFIVRHMRNGESVRFGFLGSFRPTLKTKGVEEREQFRVHHITQVRTRFSPGSYLRFEMSPKNPQVRFRSESEKEKDVNPTPNPPSPKP